MKNFSLISLFLSVFFTSNAIAETIAVVDVQYIESKSQKVESFTKDLLKKEGEYKEKVKEMELKIEKEAEKLKSKTSALSPAQQKTEEEKIKKDIEKYSIEAKELSDVLEYVKASGMADLSKCLWTSVEKQAEKDAIDLVIPKSAVMYLSKNITNITDQVIKTFDKSDCKVSVKDYVKKAESEIKKNKK